MCCCARERNVPVGVHLLYALLLIQRDFCSMADSLCGPGVGYEAGICSECTPGTFSTGSGNQTCLLCSLGTYSSASGATTCETCGLGMFQANSSATYCSLCNSGTFASTAGATGCTDCAAGTYAGPGSGASACIACVVNTFSPAAGVAVCAPCPAQSAAPAIGAERCIANVGYYDLGGDLAGYYPFDASAPWRDDVGVVGNLAPSSSPAPGSIDTGGPWAGAPQSVFDGSAGGGAGEALTVPQFRSTEGGVSVCVWFRPAAIGVVQRIWELGDGSAAICPGLALTAVGSDLYATAAMAAAGGGNWTQVRLAGAASVGVWTHACVTAAPSEPLVLYAGSNRVQSPTLLAASGPLDAAYVGGTVGRPSGANFGASVVAQPFTGGLAELRIYVRMLSASERLALYQYRGVVGGMPQLYSSSIFLPCPAGTYGTDIGELHPCEACVAGKYSSATGAVDEAICMDCVAGFYAMYGGWSACKECPAGTFQTGIAEADCTDCGAGAYGIATAATASNMCELCPAGQYQVILA